MLKLKCKARVAVDLVVAPAAQVPAAAAEREQAAALVVLAAALGPVRVVVPALAVVLPEPAVQELELALVQEPALGLLERAALEQRVRRVQVPRPPGPERLAPQPRQRLPWAASRLVRLPQRQSL